MAVVSLDGPAAERAGINAVAYRSALVFSRAGSKEHRDGRAQAAFVLVSASGTRLRRGRGRQDTRGTRLRSDVERWGWSREIMHVVGWTEFAGGVLVATHGQRRRGGSAADGGLDGRADQGTEPGGPGYGDTAAGLNVCGVMSSTSFRLVCSSRGVAVSKSSRFSSLVSTAVETAVSSIPPRRRWPRVATRTPPANSVQPTTCMISRDQPQRSNIAS